MLVRLECLVLVKVEEVVVVYLQVVDADIIDFWVDFKSPCRLIELNEGGGRRHPILECHREADALLVLAAVLDSVFADVARRCDV